MGNWVPKQKKTKLLQGAREKHPQRKKEADLGTTAYKARRKRENNYRKASIQFLKPT